VQVGKDPTVCVWSSQTCNEISRLQLKSQRWVVALAFSTCGKHLVTVGADTHHTVSVWRWRDGTLLSEAKGWSGLAPAIFGAAWNPFKVRLAGVGVWGWATLGFGHSDGCFQSKRGC